MLSRRVVYSALSLLTLVAAGNAAEILRRDGSLVQPRLNQLTLSPDFTITDKPTTRTYDWTITQQEGAPDGFYRPMLVVNSKGTEVLGDSFIFMLLR